MRKIFICILLMLFVSACAWAQVKKADLAGDWYPGSKEELNRLLEGYLREAKPEKIDGQIFALISPHAGYRFSGPVAGYGFKAVQGQDIKTVIIIGFTHRLPFDGISIYDRGAFQTPLGTIEIDAALAKDIISQDRRIFFYPDAFKAENSVEMQIPFVQASLKGARIVPIAFGTQSFEDARILADALANVLKDRDDYLIVASTDMSHFHPYEEANSIDKHTISLVREMKAKELYDEVRLGISELCGIMPTGAVLLTSKKLGYEDIKILKYANSGDTFGSKDSVVGYLSAAFIKPKNTQTKNTEKKTEAGMFTKEQKKELLKIARDAITTYLLERKIIEPRAKDPVLMQEMGAFVSLHNKGALRGCIGNFTGHGPLCLTIRDMAIAATKDERFIFDPVTLSEMKDIDIEISVLSPMKRIKDPNLIEVGRHGVYVKKGFITGVYLPQVATDMKWNREQFMNSLCGEKAGMPSDAWKKGECEIYIFEAEVFGEKDE